MTESLALTTLLIRLTVRSIKAITRMTAATYTVSFYYYTAKRIVIIFY